jgi:hypothetical protein
LLFFLQVASMRATMRALHARAAPPTLPFEAFCRATALAGSRAFRVGGNPGAAPGTAGFCNAARFLPVIDLVNYAPPAGGDNAKVANSSIWSNAFLGVGWKRDGESQQQH